jgi:predicted metal-dependent hydrolase
MTQAQMTHEIPVRKPGLTFDESIPRYWFNGNIAATHSFNGLNLLFPEGERFFVKSVYDQLDKIVDPVLREQARAFAGQEGQHANQHEKYFTVLESQGYEIETFLKRFRWFLRFSNRWLPAPLRLSATAGAEHYTAIFGSNALEEYDEVFANLHPTMRKLIIWHATEEVEHRSVAYDVLQATYPSYLLRILGFLLATISLFGWSGYATRMLVRQDRIPKETLREHRQQMIQRIETRGAKRLKEGLRAYFRRDFHPSHYGDLIELGHRRLEQVGLPVGV